MPLTKFDRNRTGSTVTSIFGNRSNSLVSNVRPSSRATPLPSLHSDKYYPVIKPSIETGVLTMSLAVLNLLGK